MVYDCDLFANISGKAAPSRFWIIWLIIILLLTKKDVLEKALQKWRSVINIYIIAVRCEEDVHVALSSEYMKYNNRKLIFNSQSNL